MKIFKGRVFWQSEAKNAIIWPTPMPLIKPIDAPIDPDKVVRLLRLDKRGGGADEARELLSEARNLFHPRAFYREAFVESRAEDAVVVDDRRFQSGLLRQNLDKAFKVFPYLITVGPELESHSAAVGDPLRRYYLETLADAALEAAGETLRVRLLREYGFSLLSSMNPGSLEDWPITEQVPLFDLLGEGPAATGVRLSDSLMMIPRKSISGLYFPSEESFVSCRLCSREKCPGRKAPFESEGLS
jgi:hypothetical protein